MILALDPSVNNMGYAVFATQYIEPAIIAYQLVASGVLLSDKESKKQVLEKRIETMLHKMASMEWYAEGGWANGGLVVIEQVVIEQPEPWGSYKSMASDKSGSLVMLHLMVGALIGWFAQKADTEVRLVKVSQWKGQLPKKVTQDRLKKRYGRVFQSDEADAVGLGEWYIKWLQTNPAK
jgi:hypothetical protein